MTALGRLIQHYLDAHPEVNKKDLATAAGVSPQSLSGWLNGSKPRNLAPENIVGLASAMGIDPMDVVEAISADKGIPTQRVEMSPELRVTVASLRKLSPDRLKTLTRMAAELARDDRA